MAALNRNTSCNDCVKQTTPCKLTALSNAHIVAALSAPSPVFESVGGRYLTGRLKTIGLFTSHASAHWRQGEVLFQSMSLDCLETDEMTINSTCWRSINGIRSRLWNPKVN